MKYQIEIVETLSRTVEIVAENAEGAVAVVRQKYRDGEIVLGGDDCIDREIKVVDGC